MPYSEGVISTCKVNVLTLSDMAPRRHISYGLAWNGIPFLQEWNTHSIWNGMVHFIAAGME
jgi:hypothetical protein